MNSKQLQYALQLAEVRNFSQVAESFNITQPALSKQILSLEKELGVQLFNRSTLPLSLTQAGESFAVEAKEFLQKEEQLRRSMDSFKTGAKGKLVIGVSPFRCSYMMPPLVKQLRDEFPELKIVLKENNSTKLYKEALDGRYDFAIINLPVDSSMLEAVPLEPEALVLAVPEKMCTALTASQESDENSMPAINLQCCKGLPFIVLSKQQELRRLFDNICALEEFHPEICAEVIGIITAWAMVQAGVGAAVLPLSLIKNNKLAGGVRFYSLRNNSPTRQPAVIYRKGHKLSKYAEYAIQALLD